MSAAAGGRSDVYRITNNSSSIVDTHLLVVAHGLSDQIELENASGRTSAGDPYLRVFLPDGVLLPGQSIVGRCASGGESHAPPVSFTLDAPLGTGQPLVGYAKGRALDWLECVPRGSEAPPSSGVTAPAIPSGAVLALRTPKSGESHGFAATMSCRSSWTEPIASRRRSERLEPVRSARAAVSGRERGHWQA